MRTPPRPPIQARTSPRRGRTARAVALALAGGALLLAASLRDPTPRFLERRSHLVAARGGALEVVEGHHVQPIRLTAASGLEVELLLKHPRHDVAAEGDPVDARRPLVLLLGGLNTGREAVRLIPETRGAVVAALSYPYRGARRAKGLQVVRHVPAIREAVFDTPPAVMLALDYLLARPDVDPARVEGVGVSLGAPFVVIAGALDPRITRVWAIHGSGGSYGPLEVNLRRSIPAAPVRVAVAGLATVLISGPRLAPERWADRIAPRPFVMLNALQDQRMPRHLVERLYDSAREPKSMIWLHGDHVRSRPEVVRPLIDTVIARMHAAP